MCKFQEPKIVFENFFEFIGDSYIVAHNSKYDERMINFALREIKKQHPDAKIPNETPHEKIICSMKTFKVFFNKILFCNKKRNIIQKKKRKI